MIPEIIRIMSFFIPIPFMLLFYLKTDKLNFLDKYSFLILFVPILMQTLYTDNIGFKFELVMAYTVFVLFGTHIFKSQGWTYPQAVSISFCLTYFGSFLWELPTHIYTIFVRGGIDGAFPLHLFYIFPIVFIYEKVRLNMSRKETVILLTWMIGYSTVVLFALVGTSYNIWNVNLNSVPQQNIMETLWMINRIVVITGLFALYINSRLRKKHNGEIKNEQT